MHRCTSDIWFWMERPAIVSDKRFVLCHARFSFFVTTELSDVLCVLSQLHLSDAETERCASHWDAWRQVQQSGGMQYDIHDTPRIEHRDRRKTQRRLRYVEISRGKESISLQRTPRGSCEMSDPDAYGAQEGVSDVLHCRGLPWWHFCLLPQRSLPYLSIFILHLCMKVDRLKYEAKWSELKWLNSDTKCCTFWN